MKKQIFAALMVLMLILSGCSAVSTVPDEFVTETEVTASEEAENSLFPSESMETAIPEENESPESTAAPETETTEPPKEESKTKETTPAVTAPKENESIPAETPPAKPVETETPKEIPKPAEMQPKPTPEDTKPKSAYDFEFDIETIKADCIAIGQGMETEYPDKTDDERYMMMHEINAEYLDDERANLDIQLSTPILVCADLGLWNGRKSGYKIIDIRHSGLTKNGNKIIHATHQKRHWRLNQCRFLHR